MIPKKIHYCWFGGNPLTPLALKCINSWKKFFPDYEIIEWNEDNFDVNSIPYTEQAYREKKYAFVSDYARFKILYEEGGIYFDTDVEVIKSFDDIIAKGPFMGCELKNPLQGVAPGLGLGIEQKHPLYKDIIDSYQDLVFIKPDGTHNLKTVVKYVTEILINAGLHDTETIQCIEGIFIYPYDYFNPFDNNTGILKVTINTHSIHWFAKSWLNSNKIRVFISRLIHRFLGIEFSGKIKKMLKI